MFEIIGSILEISGLVLIIMFIADYILGYANNPSATRDGMIGQIYKGLDFLYHDILNYTRKK